MIGFSNCKINLGLHIFDKRPDGYHNIETVFYPIKWFDTIEIIANKNIAETSLKIYGASIPGNASDNLILKAYNLLKNNYDLPPVEIILLKNLPIGAGLGAGSANAACTLQVLNNKFGLNLTAQELQALAAKLGSDCSFFINNAPSYTFGRGTELEQIDLNLQNYFVVIVKHQVHVSTQQAYENAYKRGKKTSTETLKDILSQPVNEWKNTLANDFETSVFKLHPELYETKVKLYGLGAVYASMSGSGSAVFGLFKEEVNLKKHFPQAVYFNGWL